MNTHPAEQHRTPDRTPPGSMLCALARGGSGTMWGSELAGLARCDAFGSLVLLWRLPASADVPLGSASIEDIIDHARVVEFINCIETVLPVRYGWPDSRRGELDTWLGEHVAGLERLLEFVSGCLEFHVRVLAAEVSIESAKRVVDILDARATSQSPSGSPPSPHGVSPPACGAAYLRALAAQHQEDARRHKRLRTLFAPLADLAHATQAQPSELPGGFTTPSSAGPSVPLFEADYLVARECCTEFRKRAKEVVAQSTAASRSAEQVIFMGPRAPYAFAAHVALGGGTSC